MVALMAALVPLWDFPMAAQKADLKAGQMVRLTADQ
jgi:hypothetical protein